MKVRFQPTNRRIGKSKNRRRGSALLIVLGMLAFMVVSAVAFSAYMRYARLPSSYLRRSSASRLLVKAAVARAIDAVDNAIGNDPHPGVGSRSNGLNHWKGRVLIGQSAEVSPDNTLPVLTLEGLAYIPPAMINEARYYSRRSPAAEWHSFGFDSGRYAFCALDVSDCFDVNRMLADCPRSSASNRRISLSYLFENGRQHTGSGSGASEWDSFLEDFRTIDDETLSVKFGSKMPLVSLADFNLAMGERSFGKLKSPFYDYIWGGNRDAFSATGEEELEALGRMMFVTDSWFPRSRDEEDGDDNGEFAGNYYDLSTGQGQPFTAALLGGAGGPRSINNTTILDIMSSGAAGKVRLLQSMPVMGLVSLFDYLDGNRVPVSLACPTLERTPMCCALKPNFAGNFKVTETKQQQIRDQADDAGAELSPTTQTTPTRTVYQRVSYYIDGSQLSDAFTRGVQSLFTYPFAHEDGVNDSFNIDGRATVFFTLTDDAVTLRSGNDDASEVLHLRNKTFSTETPGLNGNGTVTIPFTQTAFTRPNFSASMTEEDVCKPVTLQTRGAMAIAPTMNRYPLMEVWYSWVQTWDSNNGCYDNQSLPASAQLAKVRCGIPALGADGKASALFPGVDAMVEAGTAGFVGKEAKMCVALHVRVTDSSGKTVDLVPAHMKDDQTFNGVNNYSGFPNANSVCGKDWPVMLFDTGVRVKYDVAGMAALATDQPIAMSPAAVAVKDPRYNYAPESWCEVAAVDANAWLAYSDRTARDGDIFMATSDQGYLQSIYELAFLPRYSDLTSPGRTPILGNLPDLDSFGHGGYCASGSEYANDLMWHTYRPFGSNADDFEGMGFTSSGTGFKINPYTDSTNVLMAAFANTPADWRMASTNNSEVVLEEMSAKEFNAKYAWNAYGTGAKLAWDDLMQVAARFQGRVRSGTAWKQAWRDLDWQSSDVDRLCGVELGGDSGNVWGADRKFLYGFWRDCFASKQQLFLVFVRAEPMMMGGDRIGQIPPQLGGRAVALVWRDPTETSASGGTASGSTTTGYPHRTRILFYRQFD